MRRVLRRRKSLEEARKLRWYSFDTVLKYGLRAFASFLCRIVLACVLGRRKPGCTIWCKDGGKVSKWDCVANSGGERTCEYLETFRTVCSDLRSHIEDQVAKFREPVCVKGEWL